MVRNRNPSEPRIDNTPIPKTVTRFMGMLTGEPASKIPVNFSSLNENVIDFGDYYKVRSGSRPYTNWKYGVAISSISGNVITTTTAHSWETGDVVYFSGDSLPGGVDDSTAYYAIVIDGTHVSVASTYANAIAGTVVTLTDGSGWLYYGPINAKEDHDAMEYIVMMLGKSVYVFDKSMTTIQKVINVHATDPDLVSWMQKHENDVFLFSGTGIFKVVLDGEIPFMYPVNTPVPDTLLIEDDETETKIYGYLQFYSYSVLDGTGNRDRTKNAVFFESGLNLVEGQIRDYAERYYTTPIGLDLDVYHEVGTFVLPDTVMHATHFSYYRTKNIGVNSGGDSSDITGVGNRRDLVLWVADIPVAKALLIDIVGGTNAFIVSGNNFVRGDVTNYLVASDGTTVLITAYHESSSNIYVEITSGFEGRTSLSVAIGGGRVVELQQVGSILTITNGVDTFLPTDVGTVIFLSDGTYRHVVRYIDSLNVEVAETTEFDQLAGTFKPASGNFSRTWNDTLPDEPNNLVLGSLRDIHEYGGNNYIPRRQFRPVPSGNIGVIDSGFMVCMSRDSMRYYYSQMGDKPYHVGYYRSPTQTRKVSGTIRHAVRFPSRCVILMRGQTGIVILSNSTDVGRTEVGENVFELPEVGISDTERGVNLWQTVVFKNDNLVFAVTDDGAYRYFDGEKWSVENFAFQNGRDAVSRDYLLKIDQGTDIATAYSPYGGMKLWMTRHLPNTEHSDTVYEIVQECDSIEYLETAQQCDAVEYLETIQQIGVVNG